MNRRTLLDMAERFAATGISAFAAGSIVAGRLDWRAGLVAAVLEMARGLAATLRPDTIAPASFLKDTTTNG